MMRYVNKKGFIELARQNYAWIFYLLLALVASTDLAFAQQPQTECPPECVTDSLEIVTYYPSPYGYYEELRGDKIIVGDSDASSIPENGLPPSGTITFEPKAYAEITNDGTPYEGSIYYDKNDQEFKYYKNGDWQDLSGGSGITSIKNCDFIGTDADGNFICSRSSMYGKVHDTSQCEGSDGVVYEETNGVKHCKFALSACPSGWIPYSNWTATKNTRCAYDYCPQSSCTTTSHTYSNTSSRETCSYCAYGGTDGTCGWNCWGNWGCSAEIIEIGCY